MVQGFLYALRLTHKGDEELLGVVLASHVHPDTEIFLRKSLEDVVKLPYRSVLHDLRHLGKKGSLFGVVVNDLSQAKTEVEARSVVFQGSARAILHFVSFEGGEGDEVFETLHAYKKAFPNLFHMAVTRVPSDYINRGYFLAKSQAIKSGELGMPAVIIDEEVAPERKGRMLERITGGEGLSYGLAGLVANRRAFPEINPHHYLELIKTLTSGSEFIGLGVSRKTLPLFGVRKVLPLQSLFKETTDATAASLSSATSYSPGSRIENRFDVAMAQIPLDPGHPLWETGEIKTKINSALPDESRSLRVNFTEFKSLYVSYGYTKFPVQQNHVPVLSAHFFPLEVDWKELAKQ